MVSVRTLTGSIFALALFTAPALAVPILPDPSPQPTLTPGNIYVATQLKAGGSQVNDTYTFTLSPTLNSGTSVTVLNTNPPTQTPANFGIANLYFQWDGGAAVRYTDSNGVLFNFASLLQTLATSPIALHVFTVAVNGGGLLAGGVLSNGGIYNFDLSVDCAPGNTSCGPGRTPIPGAVFLFGSVLAGGVGGMQLMRRRRVARSA